MIRPRRLLPVLACLAVAGLAASNLPWSELTPSDWLYGLATRIALVDGHPVHYPTPTAELAKALEGSQQVDALRQLADARLALGDRAGALDALQSWGEASAKLGRPAAGQAWDEAARWAEAHGALAAAFQDAERALLDLPEDAARALATDRIAWADRHPELADPLALRQARAARFPADGTYLEDWIRALEKAGRLDDAAKALGASQALSPERRVLMQARLRADHGDRHGAFLALDAVLSPDPGQAWSAAFRRAYAQRVDEGAPSAPTAWRAALEKGYDGGALVRLATYFEGRDRGDAVAALLDQVERRQAEALGRPGYLLLARLRAEVDAVPEAFRARLAAAQLGGAADQAGDLAALARLALRAGGRPLPWGTYNDEAYRWAAGTDRTPGFWTGGLSFFLTGQDWKDALDRLESESLPDRTFAVARALADLLQRRAPGSPELPALKAAIMARFVERGEGQQALAMLPELESAPAPIADEARRIALLAARQVEVPLDEEVRLYKARLAAAAPAGSRPSPEPANRYGYGEDEGGAGLPPRTDYGTLLEEALSRLESRDPSHRASLDLCLTELDRLPDDEALWLSLADRLEGWRLDDGLGPRLQGALARFQGEGIWDRAARWYARRSYHADLRKLGEDLVARFRGSELFARAGADDLLVDIPDQARQGHPSLVRWADWVRLKALERFPHSPAVFHEAARLVPEARWRKDWQDPLFRQREARTPSRAVLAPDALLAERGWAILFVDAGRREAYFADAMADGTLEAKLDALEAKTDRTPVEDQLLFEGRARLSEFERALAPAERLAAAYPGDGDLAQRVLTLHRSLDGLDGAQAPAAAALVARTAPALEDPNPLWTSLGELQEDRGHPEAAIAVWRHLLDRDPRDPAKVSELATLLWDYDHDREALDVVEQGRKALGRPRFFAFETGVLRENVHDLDGAIREYLGALEPEDERGYGSWFEQDQRSLRRLAQLVARPKVYALVQRRIEALKAGNAEDEHALAAFFPLATIETPAPGLDYDADDWIDGMDQPNDPVGREQRAAATAKARPREHDAIRRLGDLMLAKAQAMAAQATAPAFLDAVDGWSQPLVQARWKQPEIAGLQNTLMARRAQLAPTEEDRIRLEMDRATFLAAHGRGAEADALWAQLSPRIGALPEGVIRMRAEAQRAAYLERAKGAAAAAAEWDRLSARYPWSLGVLQDHAAFLARTGQGEQGRALLEAASAKAGAGHREDLLTQVTRDALAASDLARARRAADQLLATPDLEDGPRLSAVRLVARLSWREKPDWDPAPLIEAQKAKLKPELAADLYHTLAEAADDEGRGAAALPLWIEALNRRTDRDWLQAAARATRKAGTEPQLLAFFEKQRARSPRDVRWAVAVRDLKRDAHDVDGAIEAARAAVAVRPEQELLWQEAADLLVRAGRVAEAADFLAGWAKPRPADESVAGWRSGLYAQAGQGDKALATEREALAAFRRANPGDADGLRARLGRAVGRLMADGEPDRALKLAPKGDITALDGALAPEDQVRLALLTGQLPRLLAHGSSRAPQDQEGLLDAAGAILAQTGRVEWLDAAQAFVLAQLLPPTGPDAAALNTWWPFVRRAGLEGPVRLALAQQVAGANPGPWQAAAPVAFLQEVGEARVGRDRWGKFAFQEPELGRLWVRQLVRADQGEALVAYLQPQWQQALALVEGPSPLNDNSPRLPWAAWLDEPGALEAWARAAAAHPETGPMLARLMGDRYHWDRFWAAAARGWGNGPLVDLLPAPSRLAWSRLWDRDETDPVKLARRRTVEAVATALGRLVDGQPGAADDPLIVKLRGPQTVGAVLGHDAAWLWPEFTPRRTAAGQLAEVGDDRITGQGVDAGRLPGALWGERPGDAWFVLEALARYRKGDATAPWLPVVAPGRGGETARALLAVRLARAMGQVPLALELSARHAAPAGDRTWLAEQLSLLAAAGRKDEAEAKLRQAVRADQAGMTEASFRWFAAQAEDRSLASPLDLLDPAQPVGPAFLAYLQDRQPEAAPRFRTADPEGYLQALGLRWDARQDRLGPDQLRRWLKELWAQHAAELPRARNLAKLGPVWAAARPWLARQEADRPGALEALDQALAPGGDPSRLFARLALDATDDGDRLLAVRVRLARHEDAAALALGDRMLGDLAQGRALGFDPVPVSAPAEGPEDTADEGGMEDAPEPSTAPGDDAVAARLAAWLAPFRQVHRAEAFEAKVRGLLQDRRAAGPLSPGLWRLSFELAAPADRPALAQELDAAWFRGELQPDQAGELAEALAATLPAEAPRWLDRWPARPDAAQAQARSRILAALHRPADAAAALFAARRSGAWSGGDELRAFDRWRKLGAPASAAPAAWRDALPAWQGSPEAAAAFLEGHLARHPSDVLAARAALRGLGGAPADALARAGLALQAHGAGEDGDDLAILRLRAARGLLPASWRAACAAAGALDGRDLARILARRRYRTADLNAALADLARIAARAGETGRMQSALQALQDRRAPGLPALRAELAAAAPPAPVQASTAPLLRPRDLTWTLLARAVRKEGAR